MTEKIKDMQLGDFYDMLERRSRITISLMSEASCHYVKNSNLKNGTVSIKDSIELERPHPRAEEQGVVVSEVTVNRFEYRPGRTIEYFQDISDKMSKLFDLIYENAGQFDFYSTEEKLDPLPFGYVVISTNQIGDSEKKEYVHHIRFNGLLFMILNFRNAKIGVRAQMGDSRFYISNSYTENYGRQHIRRYKQAFWPCPSDRGTLNGWCRSSIKSMERFIDQLLVIWE